MLLVGVNIPNFWLVAASRVLNYKTRTIPFSHLGLPICGDSRKLNFWYSLIDRIKSRLSVWKSRNLSMRVAWFSWRMSCPLYQSILFSSSRLMHVSFLISNLSLIVFYGWWGRGVVENYRKITWIKWETICIEKEFRGLRVRRIREFNVAILGKWCWRLREEKERLWHRVLPAHYGEVGGRIDKGGRLDSMWRKNIYVICQGVGLGVWNWFQYNFSCNVDDMSSTLFWWNPWLTRGVLKERLCRLFDLAENKMVSVLDESLRLGADWEAWKWHRRLLAQEEK